MIYNIKSYYNWLFIALHGALAGLHQSSLLTDVPPRTKKNQIGCWQIAVEMPGHSLNHVSTWVPGVGWAHIHPCFQECICSLSLYPFPPSPPTPCFLLLALQSLNWGGLHSSAHPFLQAVAGRGELVPLSLVLLCGTCVSNKGSLITVVCFTQI